VASARFGGKGVWRMKNVKVSGTFGGDSSQVIGYGACAAPLSRCIRQKSAVDRGSNR
jgi:hypothetical protein